MSRRELCACGVSLFVADRRDWLAIFAMLTRHNATDQHMAWRQGGVA